MARAKEPAAILTAATNAVAMNDPALNWRPTAILAKIWTNAIWATISDAHTPVLTHSARLFVPVQTATCWAMIGKRAKVTNQL